MQRRPDQTGQTPQHHDIATEHTAILPSTSGPQQPPISGDLPPVPIAPPAMRPDGGLTTYIGEPGQALHTADAAHAAQERAQRDVSALAGSLAELAAQLHEHARHLEQFVEGSLSTDLADPRTHLLSRSLELTRQADLRLARLGETLRHLTESVRAAQSNLDALRQERERLSTLYSIAQDLNTSLDLEDVLGQVMARLIEVVHAERGFLMLSDEGAGTLQFRAARGADGRTLGENDFNISSGVTQNVWQSQQPLLTVDAQDDVALRERVSIVAYGIRSV